MVLVKDSAKLEPKTRKNLKLGGFSVKKFLRTLLALLRKNLDNVIGKSFVNTHMDNWVSSKE